MLCLFQSRLLPHSLKSIGTIPIRSFTVGISQRIRTKPLVISRNVNSNGWTKKWIFTTGAVTLFTMANFKPDNSTIENETVVKEVSFPIPIEVVENNSKEEKKLRRKSYYRQLCLGSICGIIAGLLFIKVSVVALYVGVFGVLGLEWLKSRNLITIDHSEMLRLTRRQLTRVLFLGRDTVTDLNLFNLSFLTASVLTYYYI
ncbi:similar to Saccharomyces cerevisiae YAL008W FUN14 Mitochondrial protein of unknown function [Maudiozyma barnettii]|uniref:Uncharacterized protein n=1 Tax=Maudiozyma barnettii TaxID=61262 RepID=A0A8H2VH11_9SACH|nr:Fun14p [Kazachstania barnettii]CAB4255300.1 similar to Saccharomyces cerevisiae YAL008W FUN14 Mitochondrial protein of unknown function [Kazachstania barnettii]CAD1783707.1 similar to Saccharomyces cerevisiae YAL008W FUN14 Mitochondrial protein of unknown function [Kazachstania barnettii]